MEVLFPGSSAFVWNARVPAFAQSLNRRPRQDEVMFFLRVFFAPTLRPLRLNMLHANSAEEDQAKYRQGGFIPHNLIQSCWVSFSVLLGSPSIALCLAKGPWHSQVPPIQPFLAKLFPIHKQE